MSQYRVPVLEQYAYQPAVISQTLNTPPGSPVKGDRYIVGAAPTGAWAGKALQIAWYDGAAWQFDAPAAGWTTWSNADAKSYVYNGTVWQADPGDMAKSVYDTNNDGIVDKAAAIDDGAGHTASATNIADAVSKRHVQGTDQGLDTGGPNAITAAQAKEAYSREGSYDSGLKVILFNLP